jgi:hypothetical protein
VAQPNRPSLPGLSSARSPRAAQHAGKAAQPAYRARPASQRTSDPLSTRYWPGTEFVPTEFTPFLISWWSSWFETRLEIRRTRLRVPYVLDQFPPTNSSFPMRILPQLSHRLLANRRHRSVLPRHLALIQCLEEGTRPAPPPSEPLTGLDRRWKPLTLLLQSTRTAFLLRAPPRSTSPLQVSKIEFILLQDCVGGNLASNRDPKLGLP